MSDNSDDCVIVHVDEVQIVENEGISAFQMNNEQLPDKAEKRRVQLTKITEPEELFKAFLKTCRECIVDEDIERGIDKIQRYYNNADPRYVSSDKFRKLIVSATEFISTAKSPWMRLKNVALALKYNKIKDIVATSTPGPSLKNPATFFSSLNEKSLKHVKSLQKTLQKLKHKIQQLEETELDLDGLDDEDSAYIQVCRYKERIAKVHKKINELTKQEEVPLESERPLRFSSTNIAGIDKTIEKFYNCTKKFPDYRDVYKIVEHTNAVKKLGLDLNIDQIAQKAFTDLGETLKRRRQFDFYEHVSSYLVDEDQYQPPKDEELEAKLRQNKEIYSKKLDEELEKHVVLQIQSKSIPVEIDDDVPSSEEENDDNDASDTSYTDVEVEYDTSYEIKPFEIRLTQINVSKEIEKLKQKSSANRSLSLLKKPNYGDVRKGWFRVSGPSSSRNLAKRKMSSLGLAYSTHNGSTRVENSNISDSVFIIDSDSDEDTRESKMCKTAENGFAKTCANLMAAPVEVIEDDDDPCIIVEVRDDWDDYVADENKNSKSDSNTKPISNSSEDFESPLNNRPSNEPLDSFKESSEVLS